jgi:hypothetical protein
MTRELKTVVGSKCGSAYIDAHFKQWLSDVLGEGYYKKLDPESRCSGISTTSEDGRMRYVSKQFDAYKKKFSSKSPPMKIDFPEPLKNINIPGKVNQGELTITKYGLQLPQPFIQLTLCSAEMKSFFDPCVDGVIELYQGQLQQIERRGRRLKVRRFCSFAVCTGFLTLL